jgi:hypothetical protein
MPKRELCLFCGGAADLLCDGYLGWGLVMDGDRRCIDINKPYTCDAPLCKSCVAQQGSIHGNGWIDTVDHCPMCVADGKPARFVSYIIEAPEQARIIRAAHHIRATSKFGHRMNIVSGGGQVPFSFDQGTP